MTDREYAPYWPPQQRPGAPNTQATGGLTAIAPTGGYTYPAPYARYGPGGGPPPAAPRPPVGWYAPPPPAPVPGNRVARRMGIAAGLLALTVASATIGGVAAVQFSPDTASAGKAPAVSVVDAPGSLADVVAAVSPAVVTINVAARGGNGTGSGFVIGTDGTILTNAHVVAQASAITVAFADGRQAQASLVGADAARDVAVIRVADAGKLTAAALGVDTQLRVGEPVLAFGSPLGLDGSVTAGIVSALNRSVDGRDANLTGMIQTDAAINPGNSGGPLVNAAGQVVGIDTAIATTNGSGGNIGVGFAIPIRTAKQIADTILNR